MKFMLKSDAFQRLGEITDYDTIPLLATESKRNLFLPSGAEPLLAQSDNWIELEQLQASYSDKAEDLKNGLILLECFGIAEVKEDPRQEDKSLRVAGERDYRSLADFLTGGKIRRYGNIDLSMTEYVQEYLNQDNIRARQFNNMEYNFLIRRNGELVAVLLVGMPSEASYSTACCISWFVVSEDVSEEEDVELLNKLLDYTAEAFKAEFTRLRYLSVAEGDLFVKMLVDYGFKQVAKLVKEADDGRDVIIYDYPLS